MNNRYRRGRLAHGLLCLALSTAFFASTLPAPDAPAPEVAPANEAMVHRGDLHRTYPVNGDLRAHLISAVGSQVSGRVASVRVDAGDQVKKGDELARLDPAFFELDVKAQEAAVKSGEARITTLNKSLPVADTELKQAQASLEDAKLQFNRMKALWETPPGKEPSVPRKMYDDAAFHQRQSEIACEAATLHKEELQAHIDEAKTTLDQVKQALAYAHLRLDEAVIKAPFDGRITRRLVSPGEAVTSMPATTLFELQDLDHLDLEFNVPQALLAQVKGQTGIEYSVSGLKERFSGKVELVLPIADEATRTYRCRANVENPGNRLKPGMLVQVGITLDEKPGVLIAPAAALAPSTSGWQVLLKREKGFTPQPVKIGLRTDTQVEITEGLNDGDIVQIAAGP